MNSTEKNGNSENYEEFETKDSEKHEEDKALKNWANWLEIRKKEQTKLSLATSRPPECLLMNQEDVWEIKREKWLIEEAAQFLEPDKYRGDPNFWRKPNYLKPGVNNLNTAVHPAQENFDRNVPRKLMAKDHWGIPTTILQEKNLNGPKCLKTTIDLWNTSSFVKNRKQELKHCIEAIDQYKPDLNNLIVEGKSVVKISPIPETDSVPKIVIEETDNSQKSCVEGVHDPEHYLISEVPILKINSLILTPGTKDDKSSYGNNNITFSINFPQCYINTKYKDIICFENIGLVAIRYRWKRIKPYTNSKLPLNYTLSMLPNFFFNREDGIIPPGQIIVLPFWFKSHATGSYKEKWKLITQPSITDSVSVEISLEAVALTNNISRPWNAIEENLNKCIQHITKCKMKEATLLEDYHDALPLRNFFNEEEIFTYNNPRLTYDIRTVQYLKELYETNFKDKWDLSVSKFNKKVMSSDMNIDFKTQLLQIIEENMRALYRTKYKH